jgi:hypothetical protein
MSGIAEACGGGDVGRPLVPGSLRGYRTWQLAGPHETPDGMLPLTSVTRPHVVWSPTLSARCVPLDDGCPSPGQSTPPADHSAPQPGCNCGIYGWYGPDDTGMLDAPVFGTFQASGLVLMGERGFRAERAQITAVATWNRWVTAACTQAGIAVYRWRRHLLRDYPPEDLSSLLGAGSHHHPLAWWCRWLAGYNQPLWFAAWGAPPYFPPPLGPFSPSSASWPHH